MRKILTFATQISTSLPANSPRWRRLFLVGTAPFHARKVLLAGLRDGLLECVHGVSNLSVNGAPVHEVLISRSVCPGGDVGRARSGGIYAVGWCEWLDRVAVDDEWKRLPDAFTLAKRASHSGNGVSSLRTQAARRGQRWARRERRS